MNYNKDFVFYLIPSRAIFSDFLSEFESIEDVPKFTKKDFEQIVDIALQNLVINEGSIYSVKEELRQLIPTERKIKTPIFSKKSKEDVVSKLDPIYDSHMGGPLLFDLYYYDYLCLLKSKGQKLNNRFVTDEELVSQDKKIKSNIDLNNSPVNELILKSKRK
jgi:hypothetical protein